MSVLRFIKSHLLTLALVGASLAVAIWFVNNKRPAGAMTPVEAQAMDMTAMKPPPGVQAVTIATAESRVVGGTIELPATIAAWNEQEIAARAPGLLKRLDVYPGDRVRAGQAIGFIEANEYAAQSAEARGMASSKLSMAIAARRMVSERRAMLVQAQAELRASAASLERAKADALAMASERDMAREDVGMARAEVDKMAADLNYAEAELTRSERLHSQGAISLDELQMARRERDAAKAGVKSMEAKARAAEAALKTADAKVAAAAGMTREANAMLATRKAEITRVQESIKQAEAEARAAGSEADAAKAGAAGMSAMADYRTLRAPASGVVTERMVAPGSIVMMGQMVLKIASLDKVRVQADVPQRYSDRVKVGDEIHVWIDDASYDAIVTAVVPSVEAMSRTFRIEAAIENQDGSIKVGSYARIRIKSGGASESLAVPSEAVRSEADGTHYVWVVKERADGGKSTDWTCTMHPEISEKGPGICPKCKMDLTPREKSGKYESERRVVEIGASDGGHTAIVSGLTLGDRIITAGFETLQPGTSITFDDGSAPAETEPKAEPSKAAYICPMDPEVGSDKPGTCPKCKMDLVPRESV